MENYTDYDLYKARVISLREDLINIIADILDVYEYDHRLFLLKDSLFAALKCIDSGKSFFDLSVSLDKALDEKDVQIRDLLKRISELKESAD